MQRKWAIRRIAEFFGLQKAVHTKRKHSCDATLRKVMLSLDNELSEEEEKKFFEEINSCTYCLEKYHIEKSFREYLCGKIKRHQCNTKVAEQIRVTIRNSVDG